MTDHRYTVDLTRLITERIDSKNKIAKLGNDVFKLNLEIGNKKKALAKIEKEIDKMVIDYSKTQR